MEIEVWENEGGAAPPAEEDEEEPLSVAKFEALVGDAEEAFRQRGLLRHRRRFIAQYIYDALHPAAQEMDVVVPERASHGKGEAQAGV